MTMQQQIEAKLAAALSPSHLEVINESYMHRVAPGSESHFKVVVVSQAFEGSGCWGVIVRSTGCWPKSWRGPFMHWRCIPIPSRSGNSGSRLRPPPAASAKTASPKAIDELITQSATS